MRDWFGASNADRPLVLTCPLALRMALQDGLTPLVVAVHKGHAAVLDRLIAAGADVESRMQVVHAHIRGKASLYTCVHLCAHKHAGTCMRQSFPSLSFQQIHPLSLQPGAWVQCA
jgi:hypothetical protein